MIKYFQNLDSYGEFWYYIFNKQILGGLKPAFCKSHKITNVTLCDNFALPGRRGIREERIGEGVSAMEQKHPGWRAAPLAEGEMRAKAPEQWSGRI